MACWRVRAYNLPPNMCARILVVDDHELVRKSIRALLSTSPSFTVCGEAGDGIEAIAMARALQPEIILMDISMPRMNGLDAAHVIRKEFPGSFVVVISQNDPEIVGRQAQDVDAFAWLLKSNLEQDLLPTLDSLIAGKLVSTNGNFSASDPVSARPLDPAVKPIAYVPDEAEFATLQKRARTFDQTLSAITDFAYVFDRQGRFVYANNALLNLWGLKLEDAAGKNFFDLQYPDALAAKLQRQIQQVFDTKQIVRDETPYVSPTGVDGFYEYIFTPIFDADGQVEAVAGSTRDISDRKRLERDLRDAKSRLEATLTSSEIGTWTWDIEKNVLVADRNFASLFHLTVDVASGGSLATYLASIHPEDRPRVAAAIDEVLRVPNKFYEIDYRLPGAEDSVRWVTARGRVERDSQGKPVQFPGVLLDITARKHAEERVRRLTETLEEQVRDRTQELHLRTAEVLQQANQLRELSTRLLQTQDEERRRLARELHDSAGQLITALGLNLDSIVRDPSPPSIAEKVQQGQALVQQLNKEIRTMSYLLHPPLLDDAGLPGALTWYIAGLKQRSGLGVELHIADDFGRLSEEAEMAIFRIVQESLTNVLRHAGTATAIVTLTRESADQPTAESKSVKLVIQDNGKGMPPEKLADIQGQRAGVGITGMRERVRHLGGVLEFNSGIDGTTVIVTLPVVPELQSNHSQESVASPPDSQLAHAAPAPTERPQ
jgi:PAS domain S-box-containing protein